MVKLIRKAGLEDVAQLVSLAIQMWKSHTVEDLTKIFCEHIKKLLGECQNYRGTAYGTRNMRGSRMP